MLVINGGLFSDDSKSTSSIQLFEKMLIIINQNLGFKQVSVLICDKNKFHLPVEDRLEQDH